jgi:cytochrome c553
MKKSTSIVASIVAAIVVLVSSVAANAGRPDPEAAKQIAKVVCATCHGLDGISLVAIYPNLRGQKVKYMIKQLEDFRSGERKSPLLMFPVVKDLSDDEIRDLATHFSNMK